MQVINCYNIQVWDGGDRHNHRYYVANEEAAKEWVFRNKYDMYFEQEFVILDDLAEVEEYKLHQTRARALAKLNAEEKKALGLI